MTSLLVWAAIILGGSTVLIVGAFVWEVVRDEVSKRGGPDA